MSLKSARSNYLSDYYRTLLAPIARAEGRQLHLLDLGCGSMELTSRLASSSADLLETVQGMDIYEPTAAAPHAVRYRRWDGRTIPLEAGGVDVIVTSDLLHHIYPQRSQVLRETARVAEWLIIKDHFEYGLLSRALLYGFDLLGNWRNALYGANLFPERYFDQPSFERLCAACGYEINSLAIGHNVYGEQFRSVFPPRYQFIALLRRSRGDTMARPEVPPDV